jgi:hypothetical protein
MASHIGKRFHPNLLLVLREFLALREEEVLMEAAVRIARVGAKAPTINVHLVCLGMPIQLRALLELLLVLECIVKD